MNLENVNGFSLQGLSSINVILGKNGCGKSHLLKQVEAALQNREGFGRVRYISPERGGLLQYEAGIDQAIAGNPSWLLGQRRRNQSENFRQQSTSLFRRLELLVLREIEETHTGEGYVPRTFNTTLEQLNTLLERVRLVRDSAKAFKVIDRTSGEEAAPDSLSSGESELISLGIEFLVFVKECLADKVNALFVDEPDVHLHPDLQDRLAHFVISAFRDQPIVLILATHSTALLAAMADDENTRVAFMRRGMTALEFKSITEIDRQILPIFGAHPLSNIFNQAPVLLIEGEDDERLWQQAVRSSQNRIRIFPCVVDGIDNFASFESEVNNVIASVYDNARAYSLRDRDLQPEAINDIGNVVRMRLACRAAENLMLTNEVLVSSQLTWTTLKEKIEHWVQANGAHQYHGAMSDFIAGGLNRKDHDLKTIRNILVGLMSSKPWEVLVGQAIAKLAIDGGENSPHSLRDFLGEKVCEKILSITSII